MSSLLAELAMSNQSIHTSGDRYQWKKMNRHPFLTVFLYKSGVDVSMGMNEDLSEHPHPHTLISDC
jgi:hypothetical protein